MISDLCLPPLGGQAEAAVFAFLRTIFKKSEPDLVVFTGGLGEPTQQKERLKRFCAWMDECGIPWTFTFGDEDRSFFTPVRTLESTLLSSAACLYECGDLRVRGEGNYAVALQDPQRNTHWVLWMLDTGDAVVRTPFFHNVIDWCAQARAAVQEDCGMLCFCHRALPEFAAFAQPQNRAGIRLKTSVCLHRSWGMRVYAAFLPGRSIKATDAANWTASAAHMVCEPVHRPSAGEPSVCRKTPPIK